MEEKEEMLQLTLAVPGMTWSTRSVPSGPLIHSFSELLWTIS
jgi:hypothetical protein